VSEPRAAPLLEVVDLARHFPIRNAFGLRTGSIRAVDGVSLAVWSGETLGLVGESGCGKSTLGKTVMGIHGPTAGEIRFGGREIGGLGRRERRRVARHLQYVYQDPGASLDPRWKVRRLLHEPLQIHTALSRAERQDQVEAMLQAGRLARRASRPLSARAVRGTAAARGPRAHADGAAEPRHPRRADLGARRVRSGECAEALPPLQAAFALTYLFISHDLAVVRAMCQRVAVMYLGKVVELAEAAVLFEDPRHPYTRSLLSAVPVIGGRRVTRDFALQGEPPNPRDIPTGCRFRTRCPLVQDLCAVESPPLRSAGGGLVACHFA
jgi:oligopeptide/dipeptide ABC transporter ATP-binding protein